MKFEQLSFAIVGGDLRQVKLCDYLLSQGHSVNVFGFSNIEFNPLARNYEDLGETIKNADIVIGPIPCSQNNHHLFTKYYDNRVFVEDIFKAMKKHQIFMAGRLTPTIQKLIIQYGVKSIDLLERDDMAIRNATPTQSRKKIDINSIFMPDNIFY